MITVYTNLNSNSLKQTLCNLVLPIEIMFEPLEKNSLQQNIFILNDPTVQDLKNLPDTATIICLVSDALPSVPDKQIYSLKKPFRVEQFIALIKKTIKHKMVYHSFALDYDSRLLENTKTHQKIPLTEKETNLLFKLFQTPENPVSRQDLLLYVWGYKSDLETHTLETHLYRLKKKIQKAFSNSLISNNKEGYFLSKEEK